VEGIVKKLKIVGIALISLILLSLGTGWAENTPPSLLLAASPNLKRSTTSSSLKPVQQHVIKKPDLSIQNLSWSYPLKQGYVLGHKSILNFTIKNKGKAPSGNFTIKFTCPGCPPSMTGIRKLTSIAPGRTMGYNWPSPASAREKWAAGTYKLGVVVDPGKVVQDTNLVNNRKVLNFVVQRAKNSKKKLNITQKPFIPIKHTQIKAGKRITSGFDFSTIVTPGPTGIRTVNGFTFSTQPTPGNTGIRKVQDFNFIK
jgi:hypothetical protein